MLETAISMPPEKPGRAATVTSVLLHCALAIVLFTVAVPETIESHVRPFRATSLYLAPSAPTAARPETTHHFKRIIIVPKPAPKLASAMPLPNRVKTEVALPEAPVTPVPPAAPVTLNLPAVALRKPEILVGRPILAAAGFQPALSSGDVPARQLPAHAAVVTGAFGDSANTVAPLAPRGGVASTQFDAVAVKPSLRATAPNASSGLRSPIEITSKPRPRYTEEARRLRIEGEVVLQVMFRASSEICVLRVLRGLGHGLDENAISAAMAIHFRPATDGGRPIDDIATVRVMFQLAD